MYQLLIYSDGVQRTVEYLVQCLFRNIVYPGLDVAIKLLQDSLNLPKDHLVLEFSQRNDGSFMNAQLTIRNHFLQINLVDISQSFASWTGALRRIEREGVRGGVAIRNARSGAHQATGEVLHGTRIVVHNHQQPFALLHSHLNALLQSVVGTVFHSQAVNHYLDIMHFIAVNLHAASDFLHFAVHANVQIPFMAHVLEELTIMALTTSDHRGENENLLAGVIVGHHLNYLLFRVFHHRFACHVTKCLAGTGKQQSHIVVYLRSGADG